MGVKGHTFFKGISPKVNVVVQVEFKFITMAQWHVTHCATVILPPNVFQRNINWNVFVYNFVSPNVSLFPLQVCCILVSMCLHLIQWK